MTTITKKDLNSLYQWSSTANFLTRKAPTSEGYANKEIQYCWLKVVAKRLTIRKKLMTDEIFQIYKNNNILFSMYVVFDKNTKLGPHRDPNIYREPYKRIQIPIEIPDKDKCYMIWKGKKVHWEEGKPQLFEVMDYIHEGYNLSDKPMKFLFIDVKKSCEVEI
jgi:aspartyl/asparaginyl beta-hydroxylase (cupin superfamily)